MEMSAAPCGMWGRAGPARALLEPRVARGSPSPWHSRVCPLLWPGRAGSAPLPTRHLERDQTCRALMGERGRKGGLGKKILLEGVWELKLTLHHFPCLWQEEKPVGTAPYLLPGLKITSFLPERDRRAGGGSSGSQHPPPAIPSCIPFPSAAPRAGRLREQQRQ